MKTTIAPHKKAAFRQGLKHYLRDCRTAPDRLSSNEAFYIVLGLISAAYLLGAISNDEDDHLRKLAMNASSFRSHELGEKKPPYTHRPTPAPTQEQTA
jgi:hypothetical protein